MSHPSPPPIRGTGEPDRALREEVRLGKEAVFSLEGDLRHARDENSRWQRDLIAKDEEHADTLIKSARKRKMRLPVWTLINNLREDLNRTQLAKASAQRDVMRPSATQASGCHVQRR